MSYSLVNEKELTKKKYRFQQSQVISNERIGEQVYFLTIAKDPVDTVIPGQFYMLKLQDNSPLLARPLSVCEVDESTIGFCYLVVGEGTAKLTKLTAGDTVGTIGPIGNGFSPAAYQGEIAIVSGGIGIAPFVELVKHLPKANVTLYAGFSTKPYLLDRFSDIKAVHVTTDDGSSGHRGFITELFSPSNFDVVLTCGPEILMEKIVHTCQSVGVKSFASMDKRMACGIGACLVCTCKTTAGNKRCCVDGPVFSGAELMF